MQVVTLANEQRRHACMILCLHNIMQACRREGRQGRQLLGFGLDSRGAYPYTAFVTHPRRAVGSKAVRATLRPFAMK
jgi:hypothetical protein